MNTRRSSVAFKAISLLHLKIRFQIIRQRALPISDRPFQMVGFQGSTQEPLSRKATACQGIC
jgi:hypothetical protein